MAPRLNPLAQEFVPASLSSSPGSDDGFQYYESYEECLSPSDLEELEVRTLKRLL